MWKSKRSNGASSPGKIFVINGDDFFSRYYIHLQFSFTFFSTLCRVPLDIIGAGVYAAAVCKMRPIATDVTRSVVCMSVCVLVTRIHCAKMAEPIEMPFETDSCGSREPCFS